LGFGGQCRQAATTTNEPLAVELQDWLEVKSCYCNRAACLVVKLRVARVVVSGRVRRGVYLGAGTGLFVDVFAERRRRRVCTSKLNERSREDGDVHADIDALEHMSL